MEKGDSLRKVGPYLEKWTLVEKAGLEYLQNIKKRCSNCVSLSIDFTNPPMIIELNNTMIAASSPPLFYLLFLTFLFL